MEQLKDDLGRGVLADTKWQAINGVSSLLRAPCQVMECLWADHKLTIDLVKTSLSLLINHCINIEEELLEIQGKLTMVDMKENLTITRAS